MIIEPLSETDKIWRAVLGGSHEFFTRIEKLEQQLQEKDREIAELREKQELHWEHVTGLLAWQDMFMEHEMKGKAMEDRDREIAELKEGVRDLQDFKSKFMDFKSRCSCSYFFSYWPWSE